MAGNLTISNMYEGQDGKEMTSAKGMMILSPRKKSVTQGLCGTSSATTQEAEAVASESKTEEEDQKMEN